MRDSVSLSDSTLSEKAAFRTVCEPCSVWISKRWDRAHRDTSVSLDFELIHVLSLFALLDLQIQCCMNVHKPTALVRARRRSICKRAALASLSSAGDQSVHMRVFHRKKLGISTFKVGLFDLKVLLPLRFLQTIARVFIRFSTKICVLKHTQSPAKQASLASGRQRMHRKIRRNTPSTS